jgi:hypothetical protein
MPDSNGHDTPQRALIAADDWTDQDLLTREEAVIRLGAEIDETSRELAARTAADGSATNDALRMFSDQTLQSRLAAMRDQVARLTPPR